MTMQYVFGQLICSTRIAAAYLFGQAFRTINNGNYCEKTWAELFDVSQTLENDILLKIQNGCLLSCSTMCVKVCYGISTLCMIASLCNKIEAIANKKGVHHVQTYSLKLKGVVAVIAFLNLMFLAYIIVVEMVRWTTYGFDSWFIPNNVVAEQQYFRSKLMQSGLTFGVQYFIFAILFAILFRKLFTLLNLPVLQRAFGEFSKSIKMLKIQAAVFTATYFLRAIFFSVLGVVFLIVPSIFWRMELFFIVGTVLEGPNLFYLYISHYRNFGAEEIAMSRIQRSQVIGRSGKTA